MDSTLEQFETETLKLVTDLLEEFDEKLKQSGIIRRTIDFKRDLKEAGYLSEIEVGFWEETNLFDVMEFFVVENDKPSDTLDGTKKWVVEFLEDLIKQRKNSKK